MKLILITQSEGHTLTEKEIILSQTFSKRRNEIAYTLPDDFSFTLFLEEAGNEEIKRKRFDIVNRERCIDMNS